MRGAPPPLEVAPSAGAAPVPDADTLATDPGPVVPIPELPPASPSSEHAPAPRSTAGATSASAIANRVGVERRILARNLSRGHGRTLRPRLGRAIVGRGS